MEPPSAVRPRLVEERPRVRARGVGGFSPEAMSENNPASLQSAATDESTDPSQRDKRALREKMTVLPEGGDIYAVTTESGSEYSVDRREGRCTCPDWQYRNTRCKHVRRVAFATGDRPIPAGVDVDPLIGRYTDERPRVVITDGGVSVHARDVDADTADDCEVCDELPDGFVCFEHFELTDDE